MHLAVIRFSRYPTILHRDVEQLTDELSQLAGLLEVSLQQATRLVFKVPALATFTVAELRGRLEHLAEVGGAKLPALCKQLHILS